MKKITDFKTEEIKANGLYQINGGDGTTHYKTTAGHKGTDTYTDDDGSGNLSCNDTVTLDNGVTMCYVCK